MLVCIEAFLQGKGGGTRPQQSQGVREKARRGEERQEWGDTVTGVVMASWCFANLYCPKELMKVKVLHLFKENEVQRRGVCKEVL